MISLFTRHSSPASAGLVARAARWRTSAQLALLDRRPRAFGETFEFAILGDVEPGRFWIFRKLFNRQGVFPEQLASIQDRAVDFSIQLGDMVSRGREGDYFGFFEQLSRLPIVKPYFTVIGNHDRLRPHGRSDSSLYRSLFGRSNYFFDRGGARFIIVDSSDASLSSAQLRWLGMVLDTPSRKLVFTHMPPLGLKLAGDFVRGIREFAGFSEGSEAFLELMSARGVSRVYMGHVHGFAVQDFQGVRYILTGGGGSPLFPIGAADRFHHYLTVSVGPEGVRERVHALDGSSFAIPRARVLLSSTPS